MEHPEAQGNIYTIPAGIPFAKSLAGQILNEYAGNPLELSRMRIFLPTRRASLVLREAFTELTQGRPLLLPRMSSLGDVDEEELAIHVAGVSETDDIFCIPPAVPPLKRQILLARTIHAAEGFSHDFDHAMNLARALSHFLDQVHTEGLQISNLDKIVPDDFAEHWQITVDFLKIISEHWPKILEQNGFIDPAERRDRLIRALAQFWSAHPPDFPVIVAGSTGSIPATGLFLKAVLSLPEGRLVLPGLDKICDDESWQNVEESHPQFGLKSLLEHLDVSRAEVREWPNSVQRPEDDNHAEARRFLASEIMRPTQATAKWMNLGTSQKSRKKIETALTDLRLIECETEQQEAQAISLCLREVLESPEKKAVVITPRRDLARRIMLACRRWNIMIDDSAGTSLDQTLLGRYLLAVIDVVQSNFAPIPLLNLLKSSYFKAGQTQAEHKKTIAQLEKTLLRGMAPHSGIEGIQERLREYKDQDALPAEVYERLEGYLTGLSSYFSDLVTISNHGAVPLEKWLQAHLTCAENLAAEREGVPGADILWCGEAGELASALFLNLFDHARDLLPLTSQSYRNILSDIMKQEIVRPKFGMHPRLQILGQLEARLIDSDLVILAGLNEGSWPPDPGHDPWMSNFMRKTFGLPSKERGIGLAAHDFIQGFCAPNVILTRSKRTENAPSTPARWLERLETVLQAAHVQGETLQEPRIIQWACALNEPEGVCAIERPAPRPEVAARPKKLSVTQIDTWLRDPYSIYAYKVLRLRPLDPIEQSFDASLKGKIIHRILERFIKEGGNRHRNSQEILSALLKQEMAILPYDPASYRLWEIRLGNIFSWLAQKETERSEYIKQAHSEANLHCVIDAKMTPFELHGIIDRINLTHEGMEIIDYKSGGSFSPKAIQTGELSQLPLSALLAVRNADLLGIAHNIKLSRLSYWKLAGGLQGGEEIDVKEGIEPLMKETEKNLKALINIYHNEETPYLSLPRPDKAPRYNNYTHLARVQEWSVTETENEAAA